MSEEIKKDEEIQIETGWDKAIKVFNKIGKICKAIGDFCWTYDEEIKSIAGVIGGVVLVIAILWGSVKLVNACNEYEVEKQAEAAAQEQAIELHNYTFEITEKSVDEGRYFFTYTYYYTYNNEVIYADEIVEVSESIFDSAVVGDSINIKTLEVTPQINLGVAQ